jgi:uncharacterized protein (DUF305 family)
MTACSSAVQQSGSGQNVPLTPAAQAAADSGRPPYTRADVTFMQGMIAHHQQAIEMAALAPTNGARGDVRILAERIDVAQKDEIDYMTRWLRERGESVPSSHAGHAMAGQTMPGHDMAGMSGTLMPGMLTPEQMAELRAAKGSEFDRLFLTFMIQHHQGAMTMVQELFSTPGAGQEINVWRFAADVEADQGSEIDRMRTMLTPRPPDDPFP